MRFLLTIATLSNTESEWKFGVMKAILHLYTKVYSWIEGNPDRNVPITSYNIQIDVFGERT
jgi:hypothetical protein